MTNLMLLKITIPVSDEIENMVGKEESAFSPFPTMLSFIFETFSPFPTMFSKGMFLKKTRDCFGKGLIKYLQS